VQVLVAEKPDLTITELWQKIAAYVQELDGIFDVYIYSLMDSPDFINDCSWAFIQKPMFVTENSSVGLNSPERKPVQPSPESPPS
jgi:hypothetical protein